MPNLTQTNLTSTVATDTNLLNLVSTAGIYPPIAGVPQKIYVVNPDSTRGELMSVISVSVNTVSVSRLDKFKQRLVGPSGNGGLGATVLIAPPAATDVNLGGMYLGPALYEFDPVGGSTLPQVSTSYQPWINVDNGNQWLFSSVLNVWVPGFRNERNTPGLTAAVASAAGLLTPSGPLFHVTGTAAITGFVIPLGFTGGSFTIIPDGVFTWTAANNIALAGTAVVGKALTFNYDANTGKFFPSYIA